MPKPEKEKRPAPRPTKKGIERSQQDSIWKEIIDDLLQDAMAFFFLPYHQRIDWSQGYEILDKEMVEISEAEGLEKQSADKLFKVKLLDGKEEYWLLHIEIQGYPDNGFAVRVQRYNWLIRSKYKQTIVRSFAILTDPDPKFRPQGVEIRDVDYVEIFKFPTVKVLDYRKYWYEMQDSANPFALVVMAHLQALKLKNRPIELKEAKLQLVRLLFERGYDCEFVIKLLRFIQWLVQLPENLEEEFQVDLTKLKGVENVEIVTNYEIVLQKRARQQGFLEVLIPLLEGRFGAVEPSLQDRLKDLSADQLASLIVATAKFNSLNDVTVWLDNQGV